MLPAQINSFKKKKKKTLTWKNNPNGQAATMGTLLRPWHAHVHIPKAMTAAMEKQPWQRHAIKVKKVPIGKCKGSPYGHAR